MITPEVILLKIDQIAKSAIPITANTEENTNDKSSGSAPKIMASISKTTNNNVTVTYLFIRLIRASLILLFRPIFLNLSAKNIINTIKVSINSVLYVVKKLFIL